MAFLPKKTYSKNDSEISSLCVREKENIDPFDELLSSPLKQEVQFQPLSFWCGKVSQSEPKKKSEKTRCRLYESSDSEEFNSPCQRKRKYNSKNAKARTLQCKSVNQKLSLRRKNNYSAASSLIKSIKPDKAILLDENQNLVPTDISEKSKGWSPSSASCLSENMEDTLKLPHKTCGNLTCCNDNPQNACKSDCHNYLNECSNSTLNVQRSEEYNNKNLRGTFNEIVDPEKPKCKMFEDLNDKVIYKEDQRNNPINFDDNVDETLNPCNTHHDIFKFINFKRCFNYPDLLYVDDENFNTLTMPVNTEETSESPSQFCSVSKSSFTPNFENSKVYEELNFQVEPVRNISAQSFIGNEQDSIENSSFYSDNLDNTVCIMKSDNEHLKSEESTIISQECCDEDTLSGNFDFACFSNSELYDLIELLEEQNSNITVNGVQEDSSSTSEGTFSELKDEDTVIKVSLEPGGNNTLLRDSDVQNSVTYFLSPSKEVSLVTTGISDLKITSATGGNLIKSESEKLDVLGLDEIYKGEEKDSFFNDLRNVTTKRRGRLNDKQEKNVSHAIEVPSTDETDELQKPNKTGAELELEQTFELSQIPNRMSVDWNKSVFLSNPIFESTRVIDVGFKEEKVSEQKINQTENILEETGLDHKFALKPGKKWFRSMSVLKQLQNKSLIEERLESTKITGRNFESFVQEMLEMQSDKSGFFTSLAEITTKPFTSSNTKNTFSDRMSGYQNVQECENVPENESNHRPLDIRLIVDSTVLSTSACSTVLEKSLLNHTVKVTQPKEGPSAFRSALGLEINTSDIQENSIQEESSVSAKDFILMQCGQEDVLPFEEHFNERTLKNCKKIGEGVYGEVFMSFDSVIKIIPIEGSKKINGEPQKTFEEIISEVVIASKLSNLRKGKNHRTDCFSEMKRCWCVKGKYPKYLLKLWNDYDQQGSGSENDSPVVFEDDQLYVILELANGGKDLESFVFTSSAQSLSIFIQATFSLAVAEKAFEFEHRDLHWGNVLISETQSKFTTVVLDDIEYKIPTKGVKICIIDFTLSRINHENCCIFNDLSVDPSLFASEGDYQFEIYRMMLIEVKNDWSLFRPKTNLFWLHYMLDKMIKMVHYKTRKSRVHTKHLKDLKTLESIILDYKDSADFLLSKSLTNTVNKL